MVYTAPPAFVPDDILEADQLNVLSDDIEYLYGIAQGLTLNGVQLSRASSQSIPNATDTAISWSTEVLDIGGWWSSGANITVPAGAIPAGFTSIAVLILARLKFAANATGNRRVILHKNSVEVAARTSPGLGSGDETDTDLSSILSVAAGDVLVLVANQSSGGPLNCTAASITMMRFAPIA